MAIAPIFPVLLVAVVTRCRSDHISELTSRGGGSALHLGSILKPPPPPPLPHIVPVPFHAGAGRTQRHKTDGGYHYEAPPPPPQSSEFKFPAPFYKQYNFNFVPPPQPFSTTPSPTMFQKVSGWLFPSQQSTVDTTSYHNNVAPIKKDCNPCNLVPWLPVIRYNLGTKSLYQNSLPTYGPPSPTAYADFVKVVQHQPQPFNSPNPPQLTPGVPHANYGPPSSSFNTNPAVNAIGSTYGPPSATHTLDTASINPPTSTFSHPSSSYAVPSSSYVLPSNSFDSHFLSTPAHHIGSNLYNIQSSTYRTPPSSYGPPVSAYETPHSLTTTFQPVTPLYEPVTFNQELPSTNQVEIFDDITPKTQQKLPKVTYPSLFKNSYGEPITNTQLFDISYPISATGAESSKVKTQVLPHDIKTTTSPNNMSFALSNPAPFTLNRGRNIHTLQPVALPNLSVSPLPPIFNARPFRPIPSQFSTNILQGINQMQQSANNVNIEQSIPLAEFTHSVDYPATVIQSPIIEINPPSISNQTKGYRNIGNSYVVDEIKDISSQASEDHISATKSDASFESTGTEVGNDLYDREIIPDFKLLSKLPSNHKLNFADLRGVNDEDIDKYRSESNLQHIDSPLLYLKPSAPHKNHGDFILAVSTPIPNSENEYEIYDDIPTTAASPTPSWDDSRSDYNEGLPSAQENAYKPKIVQIIVPYTTGNKGNENVNDEVVHIAQDWFSTPKDEYQARKVPPNTDSSRVTTVTENSNTMTTTTEYSIRETENYDSDQDSNVDSEKAFYDLKEPPFDIIKLQHTIDDWTEQEYSKQYRTPQKPRNSEKYAKQIPDDYFTTTIPTNYVTTIDNNYDFYDHEGSSSIQHTVTDENNNTVDIPRKDYNAIERTKANHISDKNVELSDLQKLHIYTAASSFRTTSSTTTPAPWGKIQTSISPLTKEKVYVVTSKPWKDSRNASKDWYAVEPFESKKTKYDIDNLPFKSPRFMNRPSFGFTSGGKIEADSSYGYSKSWYQNINELETEGDKSTSLPEASQQETYTESNKESDTTDSNRE